MDGTCALLGRIRQDPQKRATLYNDGVLLLSLSYSALDILFQWSEFQACQKPVGLWLMGSYAMVVVFRLLNYVGQAYTPEGEEDHAWLWRIRQQPLVPRMAGYFTWGVLLPIFLGWTILGTFRVGPVLWHGQTHCLPEGAHPWFVAFCQVLCYFWSLLYTVYLVGILRFEYRLRRAEAALREIETQDSLMRWGRMSLLETEEGGFRGGPNDALGLGLGLGLTPADIAELPVESVCSGSPLLADDECAICLTAFRSGDSARRLPSCQHTFHKECIDLWLLRSVACPLCKSGVASSVL